MAKKVESEEERNRRIELIGEYRLKTGASTRKIAEYFTNTQFSISNYTVDTYIKGYIKKHPNTQQIIEEQTYEKMPDSIKKPEVVDRVNKVVSLLQNGFTIDEISKALNEEYWVIYRDIHNRLPLLDEKLYNEICSILDENSKDNLRRKPIL